MKIKALYFFRPFFLLIATLYILIIPLLAQALATEPAKTPTGVIDRYEKLKYGMFIHYGMATYIDGKIGYTENIKKPLPSSKIYSPQNLDVENWIIVAKNLGMKYAILTTKHNLGHCLWDSKYTEYDVATSGNKTDVVEEFVKACRKHKIIPGLYYNIGKDVAHLRDQMMIEGTYKEFVKKQICELLSNYGQISIMWLDGVYAKSIKENLQEIYDTIKSIQPNCLVLMNNGFHNGTKLTHFPTDIINGEETFPPVNGHKSIMKFRKNTYYIPMEVCYRSTHSWFWGKERANSPKKLKELIIIYKSSINRNANLLLNVPPDKEGRINRKVITRLTELANESGSLQEHNE